MGGLPTTLAGMAGFIIFVAFLVGLTVPNLNSSDAENVKSLQTEFVSSMNQSTNHSTSTSGSGFWGFVGVATGTNGIYDFIVGFFSMVISFMELVLAYLGIYVLLAGQLPVVFYVLFAVLTSSIIIGIIKLIFIRGD
jgi:hypothetical protein